MPIRSQRVLAAFLTGRDSRRSVIVRDTPARILLPPSPGITAGSKPPVRIFVGTESGQFRALRNFVWSVMRVRDPSRCYEIHLMQDLAGFRQRLWLTGFTNYRFTIPELAGGSGRAIYNDADQIYLDDPARLFDTPMGGHGVLSINDHDTSVMLIDCARMGGLWNRQAAITTRNRRLESQMRAQAGLWGALDGRWNARDDEYEAGRSGLVHYTTIHTQPWRPFPQDYVYRSNPAADIWLTLEREADAAGFHLFGAMHPSPEFSTLAAQFDRSRSEGTYADDLRQLVNEAQAQSLCYCGGRDAQVLRSEQSVALSVTAILPTELSDANRTKPDHDVVAADGLEQLPDLDMPWMLDSLFARARRAVIITVDATNGSGCRCPLDPHWWYAQVVAAGTRYPQLHWRLVVRYSGLTGTFRTRRWSGGPLLNTAPRVWILLYYKSGHRSQALGLAQALGWNFETREIARRPLLYLAAALASRLLPSIPALPGGVRPPWPDVVIASGWFPSLVARWISRRSQGNTRLILLGRRSGTVGDSQDIGIHCRHYHLPPHPQHIQMILPPCKASAERLAEAAVQWPDLYDSLPRPHVLLLVGGTNAQQVLNASTAREMAQRIGGSVDKVGGALAILTSRRTGEAATAALREGAGPRAIIEPWSEVHEARNPYLGYLAGADILIVTGESESMLSEAVATGKPVYIYPLPARRPNIRQRLSDWIFRQAQTDRFNPRGSRRPQQGLQYLCARLVERRLMLPHRDMDMLYQELVEQGAARLFDGALERWQPPAWCETDIVAQRIRSTLVRTGGAQREMADVAQVEQIGQVWNQGRSRRAY